MQEETFKKTQFIKKCSRKTLSHTNQLISFYTTLRLIQKIEIDLGLEAMLEYITYSLKAMEESHADLHLIVTQVLETTKVDKIYWEVHQ